MAENSRTVPPAILRLVAEKGSGISWVQVAAGAGAAVSSAILLSTLGVTGTIAGAAVGSIVASIASHTYARGLAASRAQALVLRRVAQAREEIDRLAEHPDEDAEAPLQHADRVLGRAQAKLVATSRLSWKHVALVAIGMFVGVMLAITAFELVTGRALSAITGGSNDDKRTTIPVGRDEPRRQQSTPTPAVTVTVTPTPTVTVTQTPTPTVTVTDTPTVTPTATANPTPTPSDSPTPAESPTP